MNSKNIKIDYIEIKLVDSPQKVTIITSNFLYLKLIIFKILLTNKDKNI